MGGAIVSLIICPECGKEISSTANKCVHCGYKLKYKKEYAEIKISHMISVVGVIGIAVLILLFGGYFS